MTKQERARRAKIKKELQRDGLIPPEKKRMNRKKFCAEAKQALNDELSDYGDGFFLAVGLGIMTNVNMRLRMTEENVGAAKAILIAREYKRAALDKDMTMNMVYELIKPILEA